MAYLLSMRLEDSPVVEPLVRDLQARHEVARLLPDNRDRLPLVQLSVPIDRRAWEQRYDLGPLLAWRPLPGRRWGLMDTHSGTLVEAADGVGGTDPVLGGAGPASPAQRLRLGYAADLPRVRLPWRLLSVADEVALARGRSAVAVGSAGWSLRARVECAEPASVVLDRVEEVLSAVLPAAVSGVPTPDLVPGWFAAGCEPERDDADWAAWFAEREERGDWATAMPAARWTLAHWLRSVGGPERLWEWWGGQVLTDRAIEIRVGRPDHWMSLASLRWLLWVAGAQECGEQERLVPARPRN